MLAKLPDQLRKLSTVILSDEMKIECEGGFDGIHEFLQTKYIGVQI
jgi:hypothetical protein